MVYLIELNSKQHTVLCVLLSVMIGTCLFIVNFAPVESSVNNGGYYVTLELSQYRDGELLQKQVIEDDYILRNFAHMMIVPLSGDRYGDATSTYKLTDVLNVERSMTYLYLTNTMSRVRLGTGTDAVAVTNYKLQTEVLQQVPDDANIWVSGNEFNVTTDSTIVSDASYAITEAGLSIALYAGGDYRDTLICRDVFSPIQVANLDVIVVRYIFRFNVGL